MMIEVHGAWVYNKGAHLMLQTAVEKLRAASPDVECCMEPRPDPYVDRASCKMFQIYPPSLIWRRSGLKPRLKYVIDLSLGMILGERQRRTYGLILRRDIDALVDVSGYRLGDAWGDNSLRWMVSLTDAYKKSGKPVILMPQMFGPFQKPGTAELFRQVLDNADLVYARDRISLQHANSVGDRHDLVRLAPDITIFADPPNLKDIPLEERRYACVVPNMRVIDKRRQEWGNVYLDHLEMASRMLLEKGLVVYIVLHDQEGEDAKLANELRKRLGENRCLLYSESDPLLMKAFIGGARLVVGSRFHALVGALATGVPVIALGWAHKYDMLLEDFCISEYLHKSSSPLEHLTGLITRLLDDDNWQSTHELLCEKKREMSRSNNDMWRDVMVLLGLQADERSH